MSVVTSSPLISMTFCAAGENCSSCQFLILQNREGGPELMCFFRKQFYAWLRLFNLILTARRFYASAFCI